MLEANEGLENIFENAVKEAEKRRHEYVTIEHVLLSLIKDKHIGTVLHDFKVQVGALIKDVEDYLDTKCNDIVAKGSEPMTPRKTASLERLMNRAFTQALFQGRQDVSSVDILISIFAEKKSYAAFFLKKHQVNKQDLIDYMWGRELIDLFKEFPQPSLSVDDFVGLLRPMPPRLYSIASSLSAHSDEVHLTVAVVRYDTHGRKRKGVCSSYLAERVGDTIPCYFHPNKNFKLPEESDKPIIMVGPGTGIAPFRAFIEERKINGSSGKNWLFFGDRSQKTDYLYGDEWQRYQQDGSLHSLDLAWSRDQEDKVYVQHKMLERGQELWKWLEDGAVFYVCGDASRMAKDVDQALRTIAQEHGTMSEEDSTVWIKSLQKEKRYLKDVY